MPAHEAPTEHFAPPPSAVTVSIHPVVVAETEARSSTPCKTELSPLLGGDAILPTQSPNSRPPAIDHEVHVDTTQMLREETHRLISLCMPIMLFVLVDLIPSTVTQIMMSNTPGGNGPMVLGAFGLADFFQLILTGGLTQGLSSALDTLCAQAHGGRRHREMWLYAQATGIIYAVCAVALGLLMLRGEFILLHLGQDPAICHLAGELLVVATVGLPFSLVSGVAQSALQAQGIVQPLVWATFIAWGFSLPAAYILGFHTPLGYMGIAVSGVVVPAGTVPPRRTTRKQRGPRGSRNHKPIR